MDTQTCTRVYIHTSTCVHAGTHIPSHTVTPQITFHLTLRALAYDGIQLSGRHLLCSKPIEDMEDSGKHATLSGQPFVAQLGAGLLPYGELPCRNTA